MKVKETEIVVIGAGPGGYTAAFRAADKGFKTTLIEKFPNLGGVCLNVGCIPSKALLHLAALKEEAEAAKDHGLDFGSIKVDHHKMRDFKNRVIGKMTGGLKQLSKARKVEVLNGTASFMDANNLMIKSSTGGEEVRLTFKYAIVATGSKPIIPTFMDLKSDRVMDSTVALELKDIPKKLLVIGGGVIGLEMGSLYAAFGSEVVLVEAMEEIATGADTDLVKLLQRKLQKTFKSIKLKTKVESMKLDKNQVEVSYQSEGKSTKEMFDRVLVAVGRQPNSASLGLDQTGVQLDERGFIPVDKKMRTGVANIFAIGDVVGDPMLAHKASREGLVAVDVISGSKAQFDHLGIPSVIYTHPELAWVGLTEREAQTKGIDYKVGKFPWAASGRATAMNQGEGLTKILFDPVTERVIGVGIVGVNAGEIIAEGGLALEMGAVMEDIALTIHAHPTLSETMMEASESLHSMATHIYTPKRR